MGVNTILNGWPDWSWFSSPTTPPPGRRGHSGQEEESAQKSEFEKTIVFIVMCLEKSTNLCKKAPINLVNC